MANFDIIQHAGTVTTITTAGGINTFTRTFTRPITADNSILVLLGCEFSGVVAAGPFTDTSVIDTLGNTYAILYDHTGAHYPGDPYLGIAISHNVVGGSDTVTGSLTIDPGLFAGTMKFYIVIVELVNMGTPTVQTQGDVYASTAINITLNDSQGNTLTTSMSGGSISYQVGSVVMDILSSTGIDFFIVLTMQNAAGPVGPPTGTGYLSYTLLDNPGADLFSVFTRTTPIPIPAPPTPPGPATYPGGWDDDIIEYRQVRGVDRQGDADRFAMFDITLTAGQAVVYDPVRKNIGTGILPPAPPSNFLISDTGLVIFDSNGNPIFV